MSRGRFFSPAFGRCGALFSWREFERCGGGPTLVSGCAGAEGSEWRVVRRDISQWLSACARLPAAQARSGRLKRSKTPPGATEREPIRCGLAVNDEGVKSRSSHETSRKKAARSLSAVGPSTLSRLLKGL